MTLTAGAQHKLTPPTLQRASVAQEYVRLHQPAKPGLSTNSAETENPATEKVSVLINLADGYSASDLAAISYLTIEREMATCFVASLAAERLMDLNNELCIRRVELCRRLNPDMNYARPSGNVENVQNGFSYEGQTVSFDGTGVIVGMMDTGLEANHINFKNDNGNGPSRIQRLWWFKSYDGSFTEYTPDNISTFTTDNTNESHATHVAGIMGGSYKGDGEYSHISTPDGKSTEILKNSPIPFYGVATGADMALSVGDLYTDNILQGVKNVFDYAESVGKPAVVNLSLGHTTGPHDGTDTYSRELAAQGKRGIICMSAGNDGENNISIVKKITEDTGNNSCLRTFVHGNKSNVITGIVDLWGTDNRVLNVQWGVYSISRKTFTPVITINSAYQTASTSGVAGFTSAFSGSIKATSYIDPNNNRFEVYTGYTNGSPSNSINDGACADNVIVVGAYVSRTTCGVLKEGYLYGAPDGFSTGAIAPLSSYGTTFNGTKLPDVCAPGARIVASYNRYYVSASNQAENMVGMVTSGNRFNLTKYYWGTMNGTSMSCPFVTGTIGLWLQADPTLDFDRIMDVINNSSTLNALTMRPAGRWGAGMLNAQKGMQYVLENRAAIGQVWADDEQRLVITPTGSGYDVFVADARQLTVTLYDLQGRAVATAQAAGAQAAIDASRLSPGLYILEARTPETRLTRKIMH